MAYDPLAPYLPAGSVFTTDHVAHLDAGIQAAEQAAADAASGGGGTVTVTEDPDVPGTALIGA